MFEERQWVNNWYIDDDFHTIQSRTGGEYLTNQVGGLSTSILTRQEKFLVVVQRKLRGLPAVSPKTKIDVNAQKKENCVKVSRRITLCKVCQRQDKAQLLCTVVPILDDHL